jgi:hypothetical protein
LSATALADRLAQMADLGHEALLGVEQAERRATAGSPASGEARARGAA